MTSPQRRGTPIPLVQAFVICREIYEDCRSHEFILVGPMCTIRAPEFPHPARVSFYAQMTCAHGKYNMRFHLHGADETLLWGWQCPDPIDWDDPLQQQQFALYDVILEFPAPGRYDVVMLIDGQELARQALHVLDSPLPPPSPE